MGRLKLNRNQLAKFLGNDHEAIRQFEVVFDVVDAIAPGVTEEVVIQAGNAEAKAQQGLDAVSRIELEIALADASQRAQQAMDSIHQIENAIQYLESAPSLDVFNIQGNASTVTVIDAGADTTTWPMLATSQTGNQSPTTDSELTYDASTDTLGVVNSAFTGFNSFSNIATPTTPASGIAQIYAKAAASGFARLVMQTATGAELAFFRDNVLTIRNVSGSTITKGSVVYLTGSNGTTSTADLAKGDAPATAAVIGVALANISNNAFGTIQTHGLFTGINTVAFGQGDTIYLSDTTSGAVTNTRPMAPSLAMRIGTVVTSSANGIVDLFVQSFVPELSNAFIAQGTADIGLTGAQFMGALGTGIVKNTTATGVLSIAIAADFPTLNQNTTGNAATVTTNANLTGPITSAGNATSVASQTGTGSKFVMDTSPTLITPILGAASASSLVVTASLSADASMSKNATAGLKLQAVAGTSYDAALLTPGSTAYIWRVITGTARINFTDATDSTSSITGGVTVNGGLGAAKRINAGTTIRTGVYTVATLPAGTQGDRAMVSDALGPAFGAAVVGGGAVVVPVYYAAAWMVG